MPEDAPSSIRVSTKSLDGAEVLGAIYSVNASGQQYFVGWPVNHDSIANALSRCDDNRNVGPIADIIPSYDITIAATFVEVDI